MVAAGRGVHNEVATILHQTSRGGSNMTARIATILTDIRFASFRVPGRYFANISDATAWIPVTTSTVVALEVIELAPEVIGLFM